MLRQKFSFHGLEPLNAVVVNRADIVQAFLLSNVELLSVTMPPGAIVDGLLAPNTEFHAFQAGQSWKVSALSLT
jgi:hypothetical protein